MSKRESKHEVKKETKDVLEGLEVEISLPNGAAATVKLTPNGAKTIRDALRKG